MNHASTRWFVFSAGGTFTQGRPALPVPGPPARHILFSPSRPVLRFVQAAVDAGGGEEFVVAALLGHARLVHHASLPAPQGKSLPP